MLYVKLAMHTDTRLHTTLAWHLVFMHDLYPFFVLSARSPQLENIIIPVIYETRDARMYTSRLYDTKTSYCCRVFFFFAQMELCFTL